MGIARPPDSPWRIAHRGHHARCVENTLEAFASAYGLGCDGVEFDVQLSSDGEPVIFHDDDLRRLAGRPEPVFALSAAELANIPLRDPVSLAVGRIPTLREFLREFGARFFYLEIKVPAAKEKEQGYWKALTEKSKIACSGKETHPESFVASFHPGVVRFALGDLHFPQVAAIHANAKEFRAALAAPADDPLSRRLYDSIPFSVFQEELGSGFFRPGRLLLWDVSGPDQLRAAISGMVAGVVADEVQEMMRTSF